MGKRIYDKRGQGPDKERKRGCWELFIFNWVSLQNVVLIIISGLEGGTKNLWQKRGKVRIKKKGVGENFGSVQAAPGGTIHSRQAEAGGGRQSGECGAGSNATRGCTVRTVHCALCTCTFVWARSVHYRQSAQSIAKIGWKDSNATILLSANLH